MRKAVLFTFLFVLQISLVLAQNKFGLVIHGGAGSITKGRFDAEKEQAYLNALDSALSIGYQVLENDGSSLDAVEKVIVYFENNPLFNSGRGCVLTAQGKAELDASIMDGKTLNAGAVAGVTTIKNPIRAAREVMVNSPHVLLMGRGAEAFAKNQGLEMVNNDYFITQTRRAQFDKWNREKMKDEKGSTELEKDFKFGTVGVATLDKQGNLAAGTSTGGMMYKQFGRVGDSPIIGAGTYANNKTCAISSTGHGEYFMRGLIAYDISAVMAYKNLPLDIAAKFVIHEKLEDLGGKGGVIGMDAKGNVTMQFNTAGMFRGYMLNTGEKEVLMYQ
jgi:L-asparaginase / beta-aspartyl-peptidase